MLVKILSRHQPSYASLMKYILHEEKTKNREQQIFTHNLRSDSIKGYTKEFIYNEALRTNPRKDNIFLYHEIISVSSSDKQAVTKEMLADLARQYISLRGDKGMYIGSVHHDKEHIHIHFCTSGVEYRTGKAFRLSKENLHDLKTKFQEYHKEKYPELAKSFCNHGKGKEYETDKEWQAQNRDKRALLKDEIYEKVHSIYGNATSEKDFLDKLRSEGIHHYERSNKATGIEYEDMKFRFNRLDIDMKELSQREQIETEKEKSDEDIAMDEIRSIRESSEDKDRDNPSKDDDKDDRDMDDDDDGFDR